MDAFLIIAAVVVFVVTFIGAILARFFNIGTVLMFGQTFASGAFIGVSILHFIPQAASWLRGEYPLYSAIILIVFSIFSMGEIAAFRRSEPVHTLDRSISQDLTGSYTDFMTHQFTTLPSLWLEIVAYFGFLGHPVLLAFPFVFESVTNHITSVMLLVFVAVERLIESFTTALVFRRIAQSRFALIALILYAAATPAAILTITAVKLNEDNRWCGVCMSISAGAFLFIGSLLWRRVFLTPFDWKRTEVALCASLFVLGIGIAACTRIGEPYM
jgi:hypothetical protein